MHIMARTLCMAAGLAMLAAAGSANAVESANAPWPSLAASLFKDRPLLDGTGVIAIEMPARAEDAAIVPMTLRRTLAASDGRTVDFDEAGNVVAIEVTGVSGGFALDDLAEHYDLRSELLQVEPSLPKQFYKHYA